MSFVEDHVSNVDAHLNRLQFANPPSVSSSPEINATSIEEQEPSRGGAFSHSRNMQLQTAIKAFSKASHSRALLASETISSILERAQVFGSSGDSFREASRSSAEEQELEWSLIGKAANQTYGLLLHVLLEQTIPLSSSLGYWDDVLGSYRNTGLYTIQTAPIRLWGWVKVISNDVLQKMQSAQSAEHHQEEAEIKSLPYRWRQLYRLVEDSVRERSLADLRSKMLSTLTMSSIEARSKRAHLKRLREMNASAIGILLDEGMNLDIGNEISGSAENHSNNNRDEWRSVVSKSVILMEIVLQNITILELGPNEFEETVFMGVDDNLQPAAEDQISPSASQLTARLLHILRIYIPAQTVASRNLTLQYGKPSFRIRYWLPALAFFLLTSTIFQITSSRRANIVAWVRDFGTTTIDFWDNWVLEPVNKVLGTIRHDRDSETAIMSKESLKGDRASLERMVVDFAADNPNISNALGRSSLTDIEIADIRAKVKEGDLTPVLRAYEKDLRRPFMGTVRGELVRALLIQIQKTKVDVEIAINGIDNLLKSQELVFGFVGLTPGVLVCVGFLRWIRGAFVNRGSQVQSRKQSGLVRVLRNIDRILIGSRPSENGMLSYKDHGLLLCEVHVLRQRAQPILPEALNNDFVEELNDLVDLRTGIDRQIKVVERIRWAYLKWLQ